MNTEVVMTAQGEKREGGPTAAELEAQLENQHEQQDVPELKNPEKKHIIIAEEKPPLARLLDRMEEWLVMQPEYPLVFLANRKTRREAATLLGKRLFTLPTRRL